jgi:hypothetical protein
MGDYSTRLTPNIILPCLLTSEALCVQKHSAVGITWVGYQYYLFCPEHEHAIGAGGEGGSVQSMEDLHESEPGNPSGFPSLGKKASTWLSVCLCYSMALS